MEYDLSIRPRKQDKRNRDRSSSQSDSSEKQPKKKPREQSDSELSSISDSELQKLENTVKLKESAESLDKSDRSSDSDSDYYPTSEEEGTVYNPKKQREIEKFQDNNWQKFGHANQDTKLVRRYSSKNLEVNKKDTQPNPQEYFEGSRSVIEPQSFNEKSPKQSLRWISTIIKYKLEKENQQPKTHKKKSRRHNKYRPGEVQAYLSEEKQQILVSANNKHANDILHEKFSNSIGLESLQEMHNEIESDGTEKDERTQRHLDKFKSRIIEPKNEEWKNRYQDVSKALKGKSLEIVKDGDKLDPNLHAERRIMLNVEKDSHKFNPQNMGGNRRPCLSCTTAMYPEEFPQNKNIHSGPYYPTDAAKAGLPEIKPEGYTCVTQTFTKDNKPTVTDKYDTDSDTDVEGNIISRIKKKKEKQTQ